MKGIYCDSIIKNVKNQTTTKHLPSFPQLWLLTTNWTCLNLWIKPPYHSKKNMNSIIFVILTWTIRIVQQSFWSIKTATYLPCNYMLLVYANSKMSALLSLEIFYTACLVGGVPAMGQNKDCLVCSCTFFQVNLFLQLKLFLSIYILSFP